LRRARRLSIVAFAAGLAALGGLASADDGQSYEGLRPLVAGSPQERRAAAARLAASGDLGLVAGAVDALFFVPKAERDAVFAALETLAKEQPRRSYAAWVELVGKRPDLAAKPGYLEWKAELLARIDPNFRRLLYPGAPARIRLEEAVFGGVRVDGIPALERPAHVPAAQAGFMAERERVFGVALGGEQRAYPLRVLDWHEMLNDVVGGQPVTLSYCTLCGSGVLFGTAAPAGGTYTFGTSGLLYRSNKLMFDRQTWSLWSNLTGEPVAGKLAGSGVRLPILALTLTTWREWRERHPRTTVMLPDPALGRRFGYEYVPGAANRRRAGVAFPVWQRSDLLDDQAEVYAVRLAGAAKVYPYEVALRERVVNDELASEKLVVVAEPESRAIRAYRRGPHRFSAAAGGELRDEAGRAWQVEEDALVLVDGGERLERLPGHAAFWFGWYAQFPEAEVYRVRP
jgi:hypothetical protein